MPYLRFDREIARPWAPRLDSASPRDPDALRDDPATLLATRCSAPAAVIEEKAEVPSLAAR